jgi:hypothetical protein
MIAIDSLQKPDKDDRRPAGLENRRDAWRKIFDYEQGKLYFVFIAETGGPPIARYQQF